MLTLLLSKRDLLQTFLGIYVHSASDFNWEKLLKYVWSQDSGSVQVEQCFSIVDYGYEFMGVERLGIQNPESEKVRPLTCPPSFPVQVWFQINEAIRQHNIPQLSGGPGSGKTPGLTKQRQSCNVVLCPLIPGKTWVVDDLASRLAKFCYTINLNENFSMAVMTRFLRYSS